MWILALYSWLTQKFRQVVSLIKDKQFPVFSVFCPPSTDDETRDLENQKRIRSFNWISPQHLDAAINPDNEKVQQLIEDSQQG